MSAEGRDGRETEAAATQTAATSAKALQVNQRTSTGVDGKVRVQGHLSLK